MAGQKILSKRTISRHFGQRVIPPFGQDDLPDEARIKACSSKTSVKIAHRVSGGRPDNRLPQVWARTPGWTPQPLCHSAQGYTISCGESTKADKTSQLTLILHHRPLPTVHLRACTGAAIPDLRAEERFPLSRSGGGDGMGDGPGGEGPRLARRTAGELLSVVPTGEAEDLAFWHLRRYQATRTG
jgi:hypothetical protein